MASTDVIRRGPGWVRGWKRGVVTAATLLAPSLLWLVLGMGNGPVDAATHASAALHRQISDNSHAALVHSQKHTQGTVAVVVSVVGIIAVVVLVVLLGSLSARRRMRKLPKGRDRRERSPPEQGRGLFG